MGKKGERRVTPSSDRSKHRVEITSAREDKLSDGSASNRRRIVIFVFLFIVSPAITVHLYRNERAQHTGGSVYRRDLVKADVKYHEILTEYSKVADNTSGRHYMYPALAYITPWNSKGYDFAKRFNSKFTHLSPVWYDLKSKGASLVLEGRHNADEGWMSDLKKAGDALLLPRVVLEASPLDLLEKKRQRNKAVQLIVTECKEMGYDGIVLESWSRWAAYGVLHDPAMRKIALQFVKQLGDALHSVKEGRNDRQPLQLVYVIGPPHSEKLQEHDFGPEDLQRLADSVDGFSLMTYDFSGPPNPGPNAPLNWIRSTLQLLVGKTGNGAQNLASKIFLGINFYGNDFTLSVGTGSGAITGRDYLALLEKHKPAFHWEKNIAEHYLYYSEKKDEKHVVFYPSLLSISARLEEARSWGTGISIWEIGQGLDYFFDLL